MKDKKTKPEPLYVEDLLNHDCDDPECTHDDAEEMIFSSFCHPDAPLDVVFTKGDGCMELYCSECKSGNVRVKLATRVMQEMSALMGTQSDSQVN